MSRITNYFSIIIFSLAILANIIAIQPNFFMCDWDNGMIPAVDCGNTFISFLINCLSWLSYTVYVIGYINLLEGNFFWPLFVIIFFHAVTFYGAVLAFKKLKINMLKISNTAGA